MERGVLKSGLVGLMSGVIALSSQPEEKKYDSVRTIPEMRSYSHSVGHSYVQSMDPLIKATVTAERGYDYNGKKLLVVEQSVVQNDKEGSSQYNVWIVPGYMERSTLNDKGNWSTEVRLPSQMERDDIITYLSGRGAPSKIEIWE